VYDLPRTKISSQSVLPSLSPLSVSSEDWCEHCLSPDLNLYFFLLLVFVLSYYIFLNVLFRFRGWQDPCLEWREWYKSSCIGW
jgi:hypothetical protein